jgi:hypothetical protein
MTDFLPHDIVPGTGADADQVQENFEAIEGKFPIQAVDVGGINASDITWDVDPPPVSGGDLAPRTPINTEVLAGDPGLCEALGLVSPTLSVGNDPGPGSGDLDIGPLSPARVSNTTGVLWCSLDSDTVGFVGANTSTTGTDPSSTSTTWSLAAGSEPIQALKSSGSTIFVACANGGSPCISKINAYDGTVTDAWVDLSAVEGTTIVDLRRMYFTRQGHFLILIAQASGESGFKRLIRVNTSTGAAIGFESAAAPTYSGSEDIHAAIVCHNIYNQLSTLVYTINRVENGVIQDSHLGMVNSIDATSLTSGSNFSTGSGRHELWITETTHRFRSLAQVGPSRFIAIGDEYPAYATGGSIIYMIRADQFGQASGDNTPAIPEPVDAASALNWVVVPNFGFPTPADYPLAGNMVWNGRRLFWLSVSTGGPAAPTDLRLVSYSFGGGYQYEDLTTFPITVPTTLNLDKCSLTWDGQNMWVGFSQTDLGKIRCITTY